MGTTKSPNTKTISITGKTETAVSLSLSKIFTV